MRELSDSPTALIDRSIRSDAIVADSGFVLKEAEFLGKPISYLAARYRKRPKRNDWKQAKINSLSQIADLIRSGAIKAFTTDELEIEGDRVRRFPSVDSTDLFQGCHFEVLAPPLDRSKWGLSIDQMLSKQHVVEFCETFFLSPSKGRIEKCIEGMKQNRRFKLSAFEEKCLRRVSVFKEICRGVSRSHYPDALGLWTAEGAQYRFLPNAR